MELRLSGQLGGRDGPAWTGLWEPLHPIHVMRKVLEATIMEALWQLDSVGGE